jgi:cytochrome c oxidase cbb3-type subunit 3
MNRRAVIAGVIAGTIAAMSALGGCAREDRRLGEPPPSSGRINSIVIGDLMPGEKLPKPSTRNVYEQSAFAVSEGQRLYHWYNCSGCHSEGGGGMGPALMDDEWIYGSDPANIFATIVEGRPNGMPSWRGRIPDQDVWKIVAYVRSLSGQVRPDAQSARTDHLNGTDNTHPRTAPKPSFVPPAATGTD